MLIWLFRAISRVWLKTITPCLPYIKNDIVIRMDDDVILSPCFTSIFATIIESNERIGAVSAKMSSINLEAQNFLHEINEDVVQLPAPPPGTCFAVEHV